MLLTIHRNIDGDIVLAPKFIKTGLSNGLFDTILCCSQHIEILTNSVSTSLGDIVSTQKCIKTVFSSKLFATILCCSQHIEILTNSVNTSPSEMRDFRIIRQVRQTTSLKRNGVSAILLQRKKVSKQVFKANCLLQFFVAHITSKY